MIHAHNLPRAAEWYDQLGASTRAESRDTGWGEVLIREAGFDPVAANTETLLADFELSEARQSAIWERVLAEIRGISEPTT